MSYVQILKDAAHASLEFYGREWIEPHLELTVIEDREKLDGISKDKVRKFFNKWVAEAVKKGDGQGPKAKQGPDGLLPCTARYQYCIYVDQESLESVLRANDPSNQQPITPYVIIIRLDLSLPDLENFDWEDEGLDPEEDDPLDKGYPPVESCKLKDVGWMKVLPRKIVILYQSLHDNGWYTSYLRPPGVLGATPAVEQLGSVLE